MQQLLFGLEIVLPESLDEFRKIVTEKYVMLKEINGKKIQLQCSEAQKRTEVYILVE